MPEYDERAEKTVTSTWQRAENKEKAYLLHRSKNFYVSPRNESEILIKLSLISSKRERNRHCFVYYVCKKMHKSDRLDKEINAMILILKACTLIILIEYVVDFPVLTLLLMVKHFIQLSFFFLFN